jgi:hypothetical protein
VEEYHQRLKAMFSEFAQQADDLSTQEILVLGTYARGNGLTGWSGGLIGGPHLNICAVEWVHKSYEPQMKALGAKEVADSLMDALEPLMLSYKADAAVRVRSPSPRQPINLCAMHMAFLFVIVNAQKMMNEWTGRLIEQDKQAEPDQAHTLLFTLILLSSAITH